MAKANGPDWGAALICLVVFFLSGAGLGICVGTLFDDLALTIPKSIGAFFLFCVAIFSGFGVFVAIRHKYERFF